MPNILRLSHCHVNAYSAIPYVAFFAQTERMDDLEWIKEGLLKPGKTQRGIAQAIGIDTTGVNRMLKGKRAIKAHELPKIRAYLEIPDPYGSKPEAENNRAVDNSQRIVATPNQSGLVSRVEMPVNLSGPKDLPILGYVKAGEVGLYFDNGQKRGFAVRPESLIGVEDAYAVYVRDDSMSPALEHGYLLAVHPHRPYKAKDNVVIQQADGQALIKRFVSQNDKEIVCEQFNPPRRLKFDRTRVTVHLVVDINPVP